MARRPNTTTNGGLFSSAEVEAIWKKGHVHPRYDPRVYRVDQCGALMKRSAYGVIGVYGWEIDHKRPVSRGGSDELGNLQPLHWRNNRGKGDNFPRWYCTVTYKT